MKTKQYLFGTMLLCANAAFISCSSSDNEIAQTPVEPKAEEVFTTITVGAPTIEADGASGKTRVAFTYDNGMTMAWEANDKIYVTPYAVGTGSGSGIKSFNRQEEGLTYTTESGGASATFTPNKSFSKTHSNFVISHGINMTTSGYNAWKKKVIATEQTQAGNNNTAHLKDNYMALLLNVKTYTDPTFSQTWATDNKSDAIASHTQVEKEDGTVPDAEVGKFIQSSCLKFDLQLPQDVNLTTVKKLVVVAKDNTNADANIFYNTSGHSDSPTNTITLNFSGLTSFGGDEESKNLVGYFMLPAADWTIPANTTFNMRVFYGDGGSDYISKAMTITSEKTLSAGTLGVFKSSKSTGWSGTKMIWSFPSSLSLPSDQKVYNYKGLYLHFNQDASPYDGFTLNDGRSEKSGTFSDDGAWTTQRGLTVKDGRTIAFSNAYEVNAENSELSYTLSLKCNEAGTIYVTGGNQKTDQAVNLNISFRADDESSYTVKATTSMPAQSNAAGWKYTPNNVSATVDKAGTVYIAGEKTYMIYAIKFVPSN